MKKLLPIGLLAVSIAALSQEQASAWINSRFGIGLNWSWQSGGNNFLWGLFRDGQPPAPCPIPGCAPPFMPGGPMPCGPMGGCGPYPPGGGPAFGVPGQIYGTNDFQFFGRNSTPVNPSGPALANLPQMTHTSAYHPVSYTAPQQSYPYANYPYYRR